MADAAKTIELDGITARTWSSNPDLLALHQLAPDRYPYLLQSTSTSATLDRYDILFAFPGRKIVQEHRSNDKFLTRLNSAWAQESVESNYDAPVSSASFPFTGGWFLFLSYELAEEIERLPDSSNHSSLPVATATRIPAAVIYDHRQQRTTIVVEQMHSDAENIMRAIADDLAKLNEPARQRVRVVSLQEEAEDRYLDAVVSAKRYIHEGDIFQANLSRQWQADLEHNSSPAQLFNQLRQSNPSPFAGLARIDQDHAIISSSPERLLEVRQKQIRTRPIAGTHPRLQDAALDDQQSAALLAHPKERAEHIMLIDLERNDLGRVCLPGSVRVPELMVLESYRHVHHIVSEVCGTLKEHVSPGEILAATFPGGTITGCPKVRCMEIIAELEDSPRGAYTGSMGYLNHDGSMDLNILIRTLTQTGDQVSFRAGAGIVADSDPRRELEETRAKAEGLIRALR